MMVSRDFSHFRMLAAVGRTHRTQGSENIDNVVDNGGYGIYTLRERRYWIIMTIESRADAGPSA